MKIRHDNTEAELDVLQSVAERLSGFDDVVNAEWLDGAFAALLCGPSVPEGPAAVMPALVGDAWERAFADPQDVAQATAALDARWRALRSQLDPDLLWEDPDRLQLSPLLLDPGMAPAAEGGAEAGAEDPPAAADAQVAIPLGLDWAGGFVSVASDPKFGWSAAADPDTLTGLLGPLLALMLDDDALARWTAEHYKMPPTREQLVDDACYAAQDLRLWWIENAPRTAPRRAEALPGRNEPCFCGSGKKFKKCHGAG